MTEHASALVPLWMFIAGLVWLAVLALWPSKTIKRDALIRALTSHWLQEIICIHEQKKDQALCYCGWRGPECDNVGGAVESWAKHVAEVGQLVS